MLSVKHIHLSGHEEIYLTERVSFQPKNAGLMPPVSEDQSTKPCVFLDKTDGSVHALHDGTIFVMNEIGKTVSRYDLGASMVPL